MSRWEQHLVNAQTEVNRAVFELNRPEIEHLPPAERGPVRFDYLNRCVDDAISDLKEVSEFCRGRLARERQSR